jgi:hypothetical protein
MSGQGMEASAGECASMAGSKHPLWEVKRGRHQEGRRQGGGVSVLEANPLRATVMGGSAVADNMVKVVSVEEDDGLRWAW